ncbi:MAG: Bug family tripartite tricarboxylate transporter substrate binding protein [Burkholderiales bacterium]|nr:Bug family tripartite tricarboxylate transporter substrate binding protein [Burkholderiales bacterium]
MQQKRRGLIAVALAAGLLAGPAAAQDYTGPVRIFVGFPAGGATDTVARVLADKLKDVMNQPFLIENRGGAGGMIATQQLKAAPADGSTVMLTIDHTQVIIPLTFKAPGYDAIADFTPLAGVATYFNAMGVSATLNVRNLNEFGAWLKANPGRANFGVPAAGSVPQFASLIVGKALGVPNPVVVPYKGGAPLVQDLLGGQVPAGVSSLTEYIEHHRAGRINVLAISGTTRSKAAPDVPTFQELGLKGVDKNPWLAFVGPKGMPRPFVDRFSRAVATVLRMPEVSERLVKMGNEVTYATPEQVQEWITSATAHWAPVIRDSGYQLQ